MNLSLERFYRQFSGEPLTLQTVIDKIRDGSFRLYIPTPQSEEALRICRCMRFGFAASGRMAAATDGLNRRRLWFFST